MNELCGGHCYSIVKPLLEYAGSIRSKEMKFNELSNKIQLLEATIKTLETQLDSSNAQRKHCLTGEQLLASNRALVDQIQAAVITKNNNDELTQKDSEISKLKSLEIANAAKIKQLEQSLAKQEKATNEISLLSDCIGKSRKIHKLSIPSSNRIFVPCDSSLAGAGWIVIQRRQDGSENFYRSMKEYRAGFGNLANEFFLGLDRLYLLTKSWQHELYIYLKNFNNEVSYARYSNFRIGDQNENYALKSLGNYSGNASDAMSVQLNMQFSAYDADHDKSSINCAETFKSGWWFNNCYSR